MERQAATDRHAGPNALTTIADRSRGAVSCEGATSADRTVNVAGYFDTADRAVAALLAICRRGTSREDISLIANNVTGECDVFLDDDAKGQLNEAVLHAFHGRERALVGAECRYHETLCTVGDVIGARIVAIPPAGPMLVAGAIVREFGTVAAGVAAGVAADVAVRNVTVLLLGAGLVTAHARMYEEGLRRGGALLLVRGDGVETTRDAQRLLRSCGAVDMAARARDWREAGWYEFESEERPFTHGEIMRERHRYGVRIPVLAPVATRPRSPRAAQAAKKPATLRQGRRENVADGVAVALTAAVRGG